MSKRKDLRTAEQEWRNTPRGQCYQPRTKGRSLSVWTVVKVLLVVVPIILFLTY